MTCRESPIACQVTALTPQQQARRRELASRIRSMVREVQPMTDGYALRLQGADEVLLPLAEFIDFERRCCPFLKFQIEVEAEGGPTWLRLSGREGVKEFLEAELGLEHWS